MVGRIATVIRLTGKLLLVYPHVPTIILHSPCAEFAFGNLSYISLDFIGVVSDWRAQSRIVYLLESLFGGVDH